MTGQRVLIGLLAVFFAVVTWFTVAATVATGDLERLPLVFLIWTVNLLLVLLVTQTGWLIVLAAIIIFVCSQFFSKHPPWKNDQTRNRCRAVGCDADRR